MCSTVEADTATRTLGLAMGWPMADDECEHGKLPHDEHQSCDCFTPQTRDD